VISSQQRNITNYTKLQQGLVVRLSLSYGFVVISSLLQLSPDVRRHGDSDAQINSCRTKTLLVILNESLDMAPKTCSRPC